MGRRSRSTSVSQLDAEDSSAPRPPQPAAPGDTSSRALADFVTIRSGVRLARTAKMPLVGLGTFRAKGDRLQRAVAHALRRGVRLIDTAEGYKNAADVAAGLVASGVPRSEVFVVSKIAKESMAPARLEACVREHAKLFGGYTDLMLLHWPGTGNSNPQSAAHAKARVAAWTTLEQFVNDETEQLVRSIGVSNFTVAHLQGLADAGATLRPAVNQVEFHPYLQQVELRARCDATDVVLQAYTSLGRSTEPPRCLYGNWEPDHPKLVRDPAVTTVAAQTGKSPEQVLLRWALQQRVPVIPKAVSPEHIDANCELDFSLSAEQMAALHVLGSANIAYAYRPVKVPK